jgi:membrane-bound ClpP family serine protease
MTKRAQVEVRALYRPPSADPKKLGIAAGNGASGRRRARTIVAGESKDEPMPFAIALLCHPAGAYACVVTAMAAFAYAWHTRSFVPGFTAAAAAVLAALAFLRVPPDVRGLLLLALGAALLQWEFLYPTFGAAFIAGFASSVIGSWLLLAAGCGPPAALAPPVRAAIAVLGTLVLLAAVLRGLRRSTLSAR